jgi:1-acyl-sn-glycerol-3-phosphate acyltransferase
MIQRSVKQRFHTIYWNPPQEAFTTPVIFVPNHHGWFDGYLMYLAAKRLGVRILDWIAEFEAFPLFAKVGGMPFPPNDAAKRTSTVRQTIRLMKKEGRSLLLFAEGTLHYPPDLWPFERSLEFMVRQVPGIKVVPVAIVYEHALHERPEAFLSFGQPIEPGDDVTETTHQAVCELLKATKQALRTDKTTFQVLQEGTKDVNERLDMRRFKK